MHTHTHARSIHPINKSPAHVLHVAPICMLQLLEYFYSCVYVCVSIVCVCVSVNQRVRQAGLCVCPKAHLVWCDLPQADWCGTVAQMLARLFPTVYVCVCFMSVGECVCVCWGQRSAHSEKTNTSFILRLIPTNTNKNLAVRANRETADTFPLFYFFIFFLF